MANHQQPSTLPTNLKIWSGTYYTPSVQRRYPDFNLHSEPAISFCGFHSKCNSNWWSTKLNCVIPADLPSMTNKSLKNFCMHFISCVVRWDGWLGVVHVGSSEPPSRAVTPLQSVTAAGGTSHGVDMSYYNKLLSHVPEDRTTVELILHCMVEQVCLHIKYCLF